MVEAKVAAVGQYHVCHAESQRGLRHTNTVPQGMDSRCPTGKIMVMLAQIVGKRHP
jgi:hypothetical protein